MSSKKAMVYVSKAKIPFDPNKLQELADKASAENKVHGITGYLYYHNGQFLQYIEGPTQRIEQLFENISADLRHTMVNHLTEPELKNFRYLGWHMRYLKHYDLQEISMEALIINLINSFEGSTFWDDDALHRRVWGMMDVVSHNQWKLVTS